MNHVYYDSDADLSILDEATVAVIGYGNQGRAQAMNMRDSGVHVIVGNVHDASWEKAEQDGFEVYTIAEAAQRASILCFLVPDEVQKDVYQDSIKAVMEEGKTLSFSHGYNIRFGLIIPSPTVDVVMVAPRMIGVAVRQLYLQGSGVPAYVAVWQDASGLAREKALALAKAIGATRRGVFETTFAMETEIDLFMEQAVWAAVLCVFTIAYDLLLEEGYPPDEVLLEMYVSGEAAEVFKRMSGIGFFKQLHLHSRTSQYGQLTRSRRVFPSDLRDTFKEILEEIRNGTFAQEWEEEKRKGFPLFKRLLEEASGHPFNEEEERLKKLLASGP